jgi:hypothetical protein
MIRTLFATGSVFSEMLPAREETDPLQMIAVAEEADRGLLRLVACAAAATLLLALATSLSA